MSIATERTVGDLAREFPAATRIFEKFGIDYCCGGGRSLEAACATANVPVERVAEFLAAVENPESVPDRNWASATLGDLIGHIKSTHHEFVRQENPRLRALIAKVESVHGARHEELASVRNVFDGLANELDSHMMKEEMVLFPYIERMERAVLAGTPAPFPPFGSVRNPVAMMLHEHDDAGEALRELRRLTSGYTAPGDACISYRTLYRALAEFEADLHQHIHLENNILFPKAVDMERGF